MELQGDEVVLEKGGVFYFKCDDKLGLYSYNKDKLDEIFQVVDPETMREIIEEMKLKMKENVDVSRKFFEIKEDDTIKTQILKTICKNVKKGKEVLIELKNEEYINYLSKNLLDIVDECFQMRIAVNFEAIRDENEKYYLAKSTFFGSSIGDKVLKETLFG